MQKRTLLAAFAAAAVTAITVPATARAQDPQPTPPPQPQAQPPATQTSKGEVAVQPTFDSLIAALNSTAAHNDKLKATTDLTAANVQVVNAEDVLKGNDAEAFKSAMQKNETDVTALRTTLGANAAIADALKAKSPDLTAADIVAADVAADGKVTVYYWKKTQ